MKWKAVWSFEKVCISQSNARSIFKQIGASRKKKVLYCQNVVLKIVLLYVMAVGYVAAGINHFWHPRFYLRIMPPYLPAPHLLNYASGIIEILLGVLLLVKTTRPFA